MKNLVDLDRFVKCIRPHLKFLPNGEPLVMESRLDDLGLDSLASITLMFDLEAEFDINFPDDYMVPETFETAASLLHAVETLVSQPEGSVA